MFSPQIAVMSQVFRWIRCFPRPCGQARRLFQLSLSACAQGTRRRRQHLWGVCDPGCAATREKPRSCPAMCQKRASHRHQSPHPSPPPGSTAFAWPPRRFIPKTPPTASQRRSCSWGRNARHPGRRHSKRGSGSWSMWWRGRVGGGLYIATKPHAACITRTHAPWNAAEDEEDEAEYPGKAAGRRRDLEGGAKETRPE